VDLSGNDGFGAPSIESHAGGYTSTGQATFPSKAPELTAYVGLAVSLLLTSRIRRLLPLPDLTAMTAVYTSVAGYLLTPFAVVLALVWARADGVRRQTDPWFDVLGLSRQLRRMQIGALLAFVIAFDHVTTIATWATARIG
jgi:hypothetical protein